jgi:hypothetical protein
MQVLTEDVLDAVYNKVNAVKQHLDERHLTALRHVVAKNEDASTILQIQRHTRLLDNKPLAKQLKIVAEQLPGKQAAVTNRTGEAGHHA